MGELIESTLLPYLHNVEITMNERDNVRPTIVLANAAELVVDIMTRVDSDLISNKSDGVIYSKSALANAVLLRLKTKLGGKR